MSVLSSSECTSGHSVDEDPLSSAAGFLHAQLSLGGLSLFLGILAFVLLSKDPTHNPVAPDSQPSGVAATHRLRFGVGENEKREVVYSFDQTWGWTIVTVDGEVVVKKVAGLSFTLVSDLEFSVGSAEVHQVRIEKRREGDCSK